jgi:hypothetical protein
MRLMAAFACALVSTLGSLPAWGQTVTLADLDGAIVETSVGYQNTARWNGQNVSTQSRTDRKIIMGPADMGRVEWTMTSHSSRGTRTTAPKSYSFTLGQPRETASMGGGHIVWLFNDGVLTLLRTYKVGGFKMSITFARHDGGLTCSIQQAHAREVGAGNIRRESAFGGSWEIISAKQISSTCRIRKS